ncbi:Sau3AI family type II restriction endonuclease [Sulfurimonas sp.]|uniref:Sau3AI family type II restriction endonuclease n=1 Tax=Sulfurimonas sp. TaxID=2022749 RepID=UPI0025CD13ED|nr:Sau3AI family type II restriction endonuclease [Sulfurimonas sp.]MCK9454295.1 DNA mismatch repair protein [Sulfurimonas sp.]
MRELPYDIYSKTSIVAYAKELIHQTLRVKCKLEFEPDKIKNKGNFGQLLEKYYFLYEPNSNSEPDFKEARLELKSSPIKRLKKLHYVSKERLVLNIINFMQVTEQSFENSSFWKKNKNLLLIFYLHELDKNFLDYKIEIADEWSFPEIDLEIIKNDWEIITNKIKNGKAHELSEGDTLYLGACTKGSKGGNLREQPHSQIKAKQRAYSLKQGYVNHIIASLSGKNPIYGKVISSLEVVKSSSLEEIVVSKFQFYYGKSVSEILELLNISINKKAKNFYANLSKAILGIELNKEIEEFSKADIIVKTVRLKENNLPAEDISFPVFKYNEIVSQKWEESEIKEIFEHKFLFIFFQYENNTLKLKKVKFWNMPYKDLQEVQRVWKNTKKIVKNGNIVKEIQTNKGGKQVRITNFPSKKFSKISHVRPHAINANDTLKLPVKDRVTNMQDYTKHCFWLNNSYIKNEIYLK